MRSTRFTLLLASSALVVGAVWLSVENQQLRGQLGLSKSYQSQLQSLSERNTQQRLQLEDQIDDRNRQLASSAYQLSNLSNTLQQTRLAVDPNYEALLQQVRDEVAQQNSQKSGRSSRTALSAFFDPDNAHALTNENMPRMYDSYLNTLGIPGTERQQIMNEMLSFGAQRYQMLSELLAGSLSPDHAKSLFGANALAANMGTSLSSGQQDDLRQYDLGLLQDTLREVYQQALRRSGSSIEGMLQDQVIQALLDEIVSAENNWGALVAEDGSMLSAYNDKVAAFDRARERLAQDLDVEQLEQLIRFIETQSDGVDVILEASSDNSGRVSITQARIGVEDLPQISSRSLHF